MLNTRLLPLALLTLSTAITAVAQSGTPIQLHIDMTDAARNLIHIQETLPVHAGENTFEYPQWIQGDHRPNGPIDAVAGVFFRANGTDLAWRRDLVDMYAFHVTVPKGVASIELAFDFLAVPGGFGSSTYKALSPNLAVLEVSSAVMYPAGEKVHDIPVIASLHLPEGWHYGSALRTGPSDTDGSGSGPDVTFEKVSIEQLIDSPIILGRYFKSFPLAPEISPKHFLDVGADAAEDLDAKPETIEKFSQLVREASALYKSHHYEHYNFVLSLSDNIRGEGLEHHQSSDNGVEASYLSDPTKFAQEPDLLAHEFTHSWNGKYRRPIGLATPDYKTPMKDDLLWVYEGMTQYWGTVLATRAGLQSQQEYLDDIAMVAARLNDGTPGRAWRNVQDTADASQILRGGSAGWSNWRRGQDYYNEGLLIWLDADTTIRQITHGKKSLDDFAALFLGKGGDTPWKVVPYTFDDVLKDLNEIAPYDWRGFLTERLTSHNAHAPLAGIEHGGYKLTYTDKPSDLEKMLLKGPYTSVDVRYSLGLSIGKEGVVSDVLVNGLADKAGFAPGDKIAAVNGHTYSSAALKDAVKEAKTSTTPIELITTRKDEYIVRKLDYHGGEKYPHLERVEGTNDLLSAILKPLAAKPSAGTEGPATAPPVASK